MKTCKHTEWLNIVPQDGRWAVIQSRRLRSLTLSLPSKSTQRPGFVLLIESRNRKSPVMSDNCSKARAGSMHVSLDPPTTSHTRPLFISTVVPINSRGRPLLRRSPECCTTLGEQSLEGSAEDAETLVYSRFIFPFVDTFCFIYHTETDMDDIVDYFVKWTKARNQSSMPRVMPEVVIVVTREGVRESEASYDFYASIVKQGLRILSDLFSNVQFIIMGKKELSSQRGRIRLKQCFAAASHRVQQRRATQGLLFSAEHTLRFVEASFQSLPLEEPLEFVKTARVDDPARPDLRVHLSELVGTIENWDEKFAVETIASSLFLDHYTPKMHAFRPTDVFNALYREACEELIKSTAPKSTADFSLSSKFEDLILDCMETFYEKYLAGASAAEIHTGTLRKHASKWRRLRSKKTCFVCLQRTPEYKLECGHYICEHSMKTFGEVSDDHPLEIVADHCFLCQAEICYRARMLPPTAGIGVLCLDGGGVRAVVTTTILEQLEHRISLPIPIQDYFQLVLGISVGAITTSAMFFKGWTPAQCTATLEKLAGTVFKTGPMAKIPVVATASKILLFAFNDAIYHAKYLEKILKETFGTDTGMLDLSYATKSGSKVALPVSTTSEPSTLLLTNYNGAGENGLREGYHAHAGDEDIKVWEANRACSAAPGYFKPFEMNGAGSLVDHGIIQNNASLLALSEFKVKYPHLSAPQYMINGSTGSSREDRKKNNKRSGFFQKFALLKTCALLSQAYLSLISGRKPWKDLRKVVTKSSLLSDRFIRLDVELDGPEPGLDDVESIPQLKKTVQLDEALSNTLDGVARRLIASLFYFELDCLPEWGRLGYSGTGTIRCLRKSGDPALLALTTKLSRSSARFIINGVEIKGDMDDSSFWDRAGNFSKRVFFTGTNDINLSLKEGELEGMPISGSPFTIRGLVGLQGLDAPFGTGSHCRPNMLRKRSCPLKDNVRHSKRLCRRLHGIQYD